jgi:hypothetical protein
MTERGKLKMNTKDEIGSKLDFEVDELELIDLVWDSIGSECAIISSVEILSQKRTENKLKVDYKSSFYMFPEYAGLNDRWSSSLEYEEKTCVFDIVNKDGVDELIFDVWLDSGPEYSISVDDPTTDKAVIEEWKELVSTIIDKDDAIEYLEEFEELEELEELEEVRKQGGSPALYSLCKSIAKNGTSLVNND